MSAGRTLFLVTPALFAAGFFAVWLWPSGLSGAAKSPPPVTMAATASPSVSQKAVAVPGSELAGRLEVKKRAATLTAAEAREMLERLTLPLYEADTALLTEALRCWTGEEPDAALEWLGRWMAKAGSIPQGWDTIVLIPMARKDLPRAIATLQKLSGGRSNYGGILAVAAEHDPAGTMAFIEKNPVLARDAYMAFRRWVQSDAAAACAWMTSIRKPGDWPVGKMVADMAALAPDQLPAVLAALAQKSSGASAEALGVLAALEVGRDPAAVLAKFASLSDDERERMVEPLTLHLAARGTGAELAALLKSLPEESRDNILNELSNHLESFSVERLLEMVRQPGLTDEEKTGLLVRGADNLKPEHAEKLMALTGGESFNHWDQIRDFWAGNLKRSPAETLTELNRMITGGKVPDSLLLSITGTLLRGGEGTAEQLIAGLPEDRRAAPRAVLAAQSALSGKESDLGAYQNLPDAQMRKGILQVLSQGRDQDFDPALRTAFLRRLTPAQQVEALTVINPPAEGAVEFLGSVAQVARAAGNSNESALNLVVPRLAAQVPDPAAALQLVDALPAGTGQDLGRASVFPRYAKADPVAASAWLDALPADTPRRDDLTGILVTVVVETDPESAWQWAGTIQNETQRQHVQGMVQERWRKVDPAAAAKALGE